jgi:periplasmic divalent cation tolerance protein
MENGRFVVVIMTCASEEEARRISEELLSGRLIACANLLSGVDSHYRWEGKLEQVAEVMVLMKTRIELLEKVKAKILDSHSYQVPEIFALPIVWGSTDYLSWIEEETA